MKTLQTINKLVARETGYDENVVELVNRFYWNSVRQKISCLESTTISLKHIGVFTVSKRMLDRFIIKTIRKIRSIRKSTNYKESTRLLLLEVTMNKLKKALVHRNTLSKQYYETYAKRAKRIRSTDTNNIQTISENTGSDNQSSEG